MIKNEKSSANSKKTVKSDKSVPELDLLFETSWEVCNKIGGIYTVLSTKARSLKEQYGDSLVFIGPDVWTQQTPSPTFKEKKSILKSASSRLKLPWGITIRTGRWDIPGQPQVILVNPGDTAAHINEIYGLMWERYQVDSLHSYGDYEEGCVFGVASAIVIKHLSDYLKADESKVLAHFDEWTTGMGLLYTQTLIPKASTIFTTHATSIGRSICGNGKPLYEYFHNYDGRQMARELNMESKHSLERAAAHAADCFTTVSEVTARECEQLLDIRPQVVTPNGFEPDFVPKTVKYNKLRKDGRQRLLKIASAMAGREFGEDTFIISTSGRNEYRNKGLDLFLDSIANLERQLPENIEAVAFILVPGWVKEPSGELLMNLDFAGKDGVNPDFLTHRLFNEDSDLLSTRIAQLRSEGKLGRVKTILIPSYLDGHDGIVDIPYYDLLPAMDLTIFASYYEPWGYTPLESVAFGVPTLTTDKAGFGQWVLDNFKNGLGNCGVEVISREDSNYLRACDAIAANALQYASADAVERSEARHAAFLTAEKADWKFFIRPYDQAFTLALANAKSRNKK